MVSLCPIGVLLLAVSAAARPVGGGGSSSGCQECLWSQWSQSSSHNDTRYVDAEGRCLHGQTSMDAIEHGQVLMGCRKRGCIAIECGCVSRDEATQALAKRADRMESTGRGMAITCTILFVCLTAFDCHHKRRLRERNVLADAAAAEMRARVNDAISAMHFQSEGPRPNHIVATAPGQRSQLGLPFTAGPKARLQKAAKKAARAALFVTTTRTMVRRRPKTSISEWSALCRWCGCGTFIIFGVVLVALAGNIDPDAGFWDGCGNDAAGLTHSNYDEQWRGPGSD